MPTIFPSRNTLEKLPVSPTPSPRFGLRQALSSFMYLPQEVRFETQEPDETIVLLLRKHWVTNVGWFIISTILIVLPFFLFPTLIFDQLVPSVISYQYASFLLLVWYLITLSYLLTNFLLWYFTVSIVTQQRIIDIDFINLLHKKFAETRIERVEDVTMRTGGVIRAFFDYGDVIVQTAAKEAVFQFYSVPKPDHVVRIVNILMGREEEGHRHAPL